jgi:predicted phosphodiesterase
MKIALASDLHLEFEDIVLKNTGNAEVLILSGDILIAEDLHNHAHFDYNPYTPGAVAELGRRQASAVRFRDFLKRCSSEFPHVVYVAGNHEFYHGRWKASLDHLREECARFDNVYFMEQDVRVINDVTFVGGTLWTDCNKGDPMTLHALTDMMNDFRIIRNDEHGYTKLRPAHTMYRHQQTVGYIRSVLADRKDSKVVVVGHHAPSYQSIHEQYRNSYLMNGGYYSNLDEFILDHPQVVLWTHGHTHVPFDYHIGTTRIACNPRGYAGHDPAADTFELKFLEI